MRDAPAPKNWQGNNSHLETLAAMVRMTLAFAGPPSVRALCRETGRSVRSVYQNLLKLEAAGLAHRAREHDGYAERVRWSATPAGTAAALHGATATCPSPTVLPTCTDPGALVLCDGATA